MYAVVISITLAITVGSLMMRQPVKLNIERDRVSLVREVENGWLENSYRLVIQNASESRHIYLIRAEGLPDMKLIGSDSIELAPTTIARLNPVTCRLEWRNGRRINQLLTERCSTRPNQVFGCLAIAKWFRLFRPVAHRLRQSRTDEPSRPPAF